MEVGNVAEAGHILRTHYDMLEWEETVLAEDENYPEQTARARRIAVAHRAVELFDRCQQWETAIAILDDVAEQHKTVRLRLCVCVCVVGVDVLARLCACVFWVPVTVVICSLRPPPSSLPFRVWLPPTPLLTT